MIEDCVRTLARKHSSTRFVRLHYQDAEMEPAGVPALIAYRGGDKFAGLVPIMEEMPDDAELSSLTLEAVMMRYVDQNLCYLELSLTNMAQTPDPVLSSTSHEEAIPNPPNWRPPFELSSGMFLLLTRNTSWTKSVLPLL